MLQNLECETEVQEYLNSVPLIIVQFNLPCFILFLMCIGASKKTLIQIFLPSKERDGFGSLAVTRGRGRGRGDWSVGTPGGMQEITYTVPADKCGLVIGKGRSGDTKY